MSKLEEKQIVDAITFRDSGHIEVRKATVVYRDGVEAHREYHRHVVEPDQQDLSQEHKAVRAIAMLFADERAEAAKAIKRTKP